MKSWTGLKGKEDKIMREESKTFLLATRFKKHKLETIEIKQSQLKTIEWQDWCNVCAKTLEDAIKIYDNAFDQWQDSENKQVIENGNN